MQMWLSICMSLSSDENVSKGWEFGCEEGLESIFVVAMWIGEKEVFCVYAECVSGSSGHFMLEKCLILLHFSVVGGPSIYINL